MKRVLLVDDDAGIRVAVRRLIRRFGEHLGVDIDVTLAADAPEGVEMLAGEHFDLVITDMAMPSGTGFVVLEAGMRQLVPVVILTGEASVTMAVDAMRRGAANFLTKPIGWDALSQVLEEALADRPAQAPPAGLPPVLASSESGPGEVRIIGSEQSFTDVLARAERVTDTDATVLVTGESGTGKEVIARLIHQAGPRREKPFVTVNCGAIPETLFESELFGHVKGAFTGATHARRGHFGAAQGGTLFLDEIGEMPLPMQVKLLHAIQRKEYRVLGESKMTSADVRFIAATNRDLKRQVIEGHFREDLFFRVNVVPLTLPPLRRRPRDIPAFVDYFIAKANGEHRRNVSGVHPKAMAMLSSFSWPGNVRELENTIAQMVVLKRDGGVLDVEDVPEWVREAVRGGVQSSVEAGGGGGAGGGGAGGGGNGGLPGLDQIALPSDGFDLGVALTQVKVLLVKQALERSGGNKTKAAEILKVNRTTLVELLKRLDVGMDDDDK